MKFLFGALLLMHTAASMAMLPCINALSGRVADSQTGEGLAYATIQVIGSREGAVADSSGHFLIRGLCAGTYQFRISHIGCKSKKMEVTIPYDGNLTFRLAHDEHDLHEVVIEAEEKRFAPMIPLEIKAATLQSRSGLAMAEMAELIPGVRVLKTGNTVAKPIFRGLHSNRLVVLNNGIRQEGQNWGTEHAPELDSYSATEISIMEGPQALRYGTDGMAGMVLVLPRSVFSRDSLGGTIRSEFSTNGWGGSVSAEFGGRFSEKIPLYFSVQGSAKKLGWVKTPHGYLRNTGVEEGNYAYSLGWKTDRWKASVYYSNFNQEIGLYRHSHLGNLTDLAEVIGGRPQPDTLGFSYEIERPRQEISHEMVKASLDFELNEWSEISICYARQYNSRKEYDLHVGFNPSEAELAAPQLDYRLTSHIATVAWNHTLSWAEGSVGIQALSRRNRAAGRNFLPAYQTRDFALFFTETMALGSWNMEYGARYEWLETDVSRLTNTESGVDYQTFQGLAIAAAWSKRIDHGALRFNLGSSWRPPAINELYARGLHHGAGVIEQGDPELELERSWLASATFHKDYNRNHLLASAYVNYFEGYIFANPRALELSIRGAFPRLDYTQTDALYWGSDVQFDSKPFDHISTTLRASMVWARNLGNGSFFTQIPAHRFDGSARYEFNDFGKIKKSFIGLDLTYTMQQYRSPEVFDYTRLFDANNSHTLPESFDFAPAPDAYFLVGLSGGFNFGRLSMQASVQNMFNQAYRDYLNLFRYYADEPGINFSIRTTFQF